MTETQEMREIERKACYILNLPITARQVHSKVVDGDLRIYYLINDDEDGERYVYTSEKAQAFNRRMIAAAKRRKK